MNARDKREVQKIIAKDREIHHARKKRGWYERLGLSIGFALIMGAGAYALHIELAYKGAELLLGAIAHFLFFGTYE